MDVEGSWGGLRTGNGEERRRGQGVRSENMRRMEGKKKRGPRISLSFGARVSSSFATRGG